ncbi:hypothetical protein [Limnofasciculus baicalensis]|uniref:Uncharacterized protein n=1 Tax=Limnofasciculus baicalensis BBK-W-15 TaxID=2699891 RepID=A0AAE3KLV5_9CYAN|nr:hypothetical protein [Limnofasciculus baicalensis]MCP2727063.1 hypothetical protein [Limnofasciculus baicalensis BBK-W-15]
MKMKFIPITLVAALFLLSVDGHKKVTAGSCVAASSCGAQPIKFVPGQRITVEVVNLTQSLVQIQQLYGTDPLAVIPGQVQSFVRGGNTNPNFSVAFWDIQGLPLKVNVLKTDSRTLRIEILPGARIPGDRAVYLQDDGRVNIM